MNPPGKQDCKLVSEFMTGLVSHIRMNVLMGPYTTWCGDEGNEGITSMIGLTTSHSTIHIWNLELPEYSKIRFDLYSCAHYDVNEVFEYIRDHFIIVSANYKLFDRDQDMKEIDSGVYKIAA